MRLEGLRMEAAWPLEADRGRIDVQALRFNQDRPRVVDWPSPTRTQTLLVQAGASLSVSAFGRIIERA